MKRLKITALLLILSLLLGLLPMAMAAQPGSRLSISARQIQTPGVHAHSVASASSMPKSIPVQRAQMGNWTPL